MRDPVVLSSGYTYDRITVNDYFAKFGHRDPQTNQEVNPTCIFENLNLRQQIETFITANPAAIKEKKKEEE